MNNNIVSLPTSVNNPASGDDLEQLAIEIRDALQKINTAIRNALRIALDAGEALNAAKELIPDGEWGKWLKDNCFLSVRTAQLYMRLAAHRDEIEQRLEEIPDLSLRAAAKLIAKPRDGAHASPFLARENETDAEAVADDPVEYLLGVWECASVAERRAVITTITVPDLLELLSKKQIAELQERAAGSLTAACTTKKQRNAINKARKSSSKYLELDATHIS